MIPFHRAESHRLTDSSQRALRRRSNLSRRLLRSLRSALPLLLVSSGCGDAFGPGSPADGVGDPRLDLTESLPSVETLDGEPADIEPYAATPAEARRVHFESAVVVADRSLGSGLENPRQPGRIDTRLAKKVRTIEHPQHLQLVWRLTPDPSSLLTFRPAVPSRSDCRAHLTWTVRTAGGEQTVFSAEVGGEPVWESEERAVELSPWAGREVELVASGTLRSRAADRGCDDETVRWVAPTLWNRNPRPARPAAAPNVVVLGLDTVRADHLGAWGRRPTPTPALDRLAEESDVFTHAFSTFNVTNPSFASIFTGLYGKSHGVYDLRQPLPEDARTWAEIYSERGYATQAVVSVSHLQSERSGLGQGFNGVHRPWGQFAAEEVVRRGLRWLDETHDVGLPTFLWLHFFDAHTPHLPPRPFADGRAPDGDPGLGPVAGWRSLRPEGLLTPTVPWLGAHPALYDAELAYLDRQIGRFVDSLDRRGLLESTWIVVVADHGENLTEHGMICRHAGLWDTTTHVPLMIRPPGPRGQDGRRFDALVQTLDLFPTLLRATGIDPPPSDGRDLYELAAGGGRDEVFAEHANQFGAMIRTATHSYFRHWKGDEVLGPGTFFYDLRADPRQEDNLAGRGRAEEGDLSRRLDLWLEDAPVWAPEVRRRIDDDERAELRALGYVVD